MAEWPDVVPLERPGPSLPLEVVDPMTATLDPLDLMVNSDRLQVYVRRSHAVPPVDEIGRELVRTRAERLMDGRRTRVRDDAEALHAWLSSRVALAGEDVVR